jgi:hypothetical protein
MHDDPNVQQNRLARWTRLHDLVTRIQAGEVPEPSDDEMREYQVETDRALAAAHSALQAIVAEVVPPGHIHEREYQELAAERYREWLHAHPDITAVVQQYRDVRDYLTAYWNSRADG